MNTAEERREFQRLTLREPITGKLDDFDVTIVDLGLLGARVELGYPVEGPSAVLRFTAEEAFTFDCSVIYSGESGAMSHGPYQAGLLFSHSLLGSDEKLRRLLTRLVLEEIDRARPVGSLPPNPAFDADTTAMRIPAPFVSYRFQGGSWRRRPSFIPTQPEDGFTVPSETSIDEARGLSASYEQANDDARGLIRLFAELHISRMLGVPPR